MKEKGLPRIRKPFAKLLTELNQPHGPSGHGVFLFLFLVAAMKPCEMNCWTAFLYNQSAACLKVRGKPRVVLTVGHNRVKDANKEAAAVLGFSSATAAYGGFFIPKSYGTSITLTGGPEAALYGFVVFYCTCIALTWWYYSRKNAEMPC
jgi:nitrate/nitrite transporter NarK